MKHKSFYLALLLALMLCGDMAYGQDSLGAKPKKPRTPEDYKPRTLKEIAARRSDEKSRRNKRDTMIVHSNILPSRVRVTYGGSARPLPQLKKQVIQQWARLYAGAPEFYTKPYETELLFIEDGVEHWLAVKTKSLAQFEQELKKDEAVDLYLIRLGEAKTTADKWELVLLVENFQKPK